MLSHDTTLYAQPVFDGYELQDDFTVPPTVTLTVEPGVIVRGGPGAWEASAELLVRGHLEALGMPEEPILFISREDSGPNQWAGLVFDGRSGGGTGNLRYATVRYGGRGNSVLDEIGTDYSSGNNVTVCGVQRGEVRLEHVAIESEYHFDGWHKYSDHGLYVHDSRVVLVDSIIEDNCDSSATRDSGVFVEEKPYISLHFLSCFRPRKRTT